MVMKLLHFIVPLLMAALFLSGHACCEEFSIDVDHESLCVVGCASCCNIILSETQTKVFSANASLAQASLHYLLYKKPYIKILHRPPISII